MKISGVQQLYLKNIKDNSIIVIPSSGGIIGRNGSILPEYFRHSKYVSHKHAEISYIHGKYFIKDLNSTNGTKVNGLSIKNYVGIYIKGGDILEIADLKFYISYL